MKKIVNFDSRWIGEHGIGRFAKEIQDGIPALNRIKVAIKPTSPFDVFLLLYILCLIEVIISHQGIMLLFPS